ncbi:hypothetical protein GCM10022416_08070 [Actinomadura keratinilytica]|uniref:Uncharacterized protein n=1 Tax=Actinomadura keratinilytica TaxID=547461 RepID=A0ABP7Y4Q8_9ACTN
MAVGWEAAERGDGSPFLQGRLWWLSHDFSDPVVADVSESGNHPGDAARIRRPEPCNGIVRKLQTAAGT